MKAGKLAIWPWLSCPYAREPSVFRGCTVFLRNKNNSSEISFQLMNLDTNVSTYDKTE